MKMVQDVIRDWPQNPRQAAERLLKEYREPNDFSDSLLIWRDTHDGWKRTELSNEETVHLFPAKHTDYLQQFIGYRVPLAMYTQLAEYDGSVVIDRTRGEISARCGGTSMNFVAINLAHDIVSGKRNVRNARAEYARLYQAYQNGDHPAYTKAFQFDLPNGNTADPDTQVLTSSNGANGHAHAVTHISSGTA